MWLRQMLAALFTILSFCSAATGSELAATHLLMQTDRQAAEIVLRVVDPQATAIPNAMITVLRDQQHILAGGPTNDSGRLRLDGLCPGSYMLEVAAQGFQIHKETIKLKTGSVSDIEIQLELLAPRETVRTGGPTPNTVTVSGQQTTGIALVVIDPAGAVVSKARIQLFKEGTDELLIKGLTSQAGSVTLVGLPLGSYALEVSAVGFKVHQEKVKGEAGKIMNVQVKLDVANAIVICSPCAEPPLVETSEANSSIELIPYIRAVSLPCDQTNIKKP